MTIFYKIQLYEYSKLRSARRFSARGQGVTQPWACTIISLTPTHTVQTVQQECCTCRDTFGPCSMSLKPIILK